MRKNIGYLQSEGRWRLAVKTQKENVPDENRVELTSALPVTEARWWRRFKHSQSQPDNVRLEYNVSSFQIRKSRIETLILL